MQLPFACLTVEINLRCAVGIIVLVCLHAYLDIAIQGVDLCACRLQGSANNFGAVGSSRTWDTFENTLPKSGGIPGDAKANQQSCAFGIFCNTPLLLRVGIHKHRHVADFAHTLPGTERAALRQANVAGDAGTLKSP